MDIFIEKIVVKKKGMQDTLFTLGIILAGVVTFLIISYIPVISQFTLFWAAAIIFGIYYLATSRNIEYEYAVTNGDLDVDMIVSRRKRKRIFSSSCKNFEVVASIKSVNFSQEVKSIKKQIKAVSSMDAPNIYFTTLNYKGERTVLFFEPDERMMSAFKTHIPRKIFE